MDDDAYKDRQTRPSPSRSASPQTPPSVLMRRSPQNSTASKHSHGPPPLTLPTNLAIAVRTRD